MSTITLDEIRADPDSFIARLDRGETVVLVRDGATVATVRPEPDAPPGIANEPRPFGLYKGQFEVPDSFLQPLPEDILNAFAGE